MIRVAIVDDEPVAREGLRLWLASEPDVRIVGEAGTPADATRMVLREQPDLLFLDVQMPEGDGFDVIEAVGGEHLPEVVFVTAHERHALRAFDLAAVDFLLKPVREERFRQALERARLELARGEAREGPGRLSALLDHVRGAATADGRRQIHRFAVRTRDRFVIVPAMEVRWIGAASNYAELHLQGHSHLVRTTLSDLERGLDPERFARIHRGTIVRVDCVREVIPASHGDYDVVLDDGTTLKLSRRFRSRLLA
ncbi:MAG: response regulator transcription factor [Candidatus Eisenbacteria bacterium]|uniref:Response regulator transcription factor n=1 Tax=Eiseniibacteriota bacterium TaxID=2212470 RepID=A0A849SFF0_UNCEI|nr:response regulator transcription factor [Candidatus Eisenbacteria bacterium]